MSAKIAITRTDCTPDEIRQLAANCKDGSQALIGEQIGEDRVDRPVRDVGCRDSPNPGSRSRSGTVA